MLTVAACVLTACASGSDGKEDDATGSSEGRRAGELQGGIFGEGSRAGVAPSTPSSPALAKPSVQQLNDRLTKAFDPAVPNKEKISWIQAAEQDPYLVANLVDAAEKQDVEVEVTNVQEPQDGKMKADAKVTIGGSPVDNTFISFVSEGGEWKVDHAFACEIITGALIESAACQD
ncbi:hypothetical protein ACWIGW_45370 [Nocardia brasiliensis]